MNPRPLCLNTLARLEEKSHVLLENNEGRYYPESNDLMVQSAHASTTRVRVSVRSSLLPHS
eukprot:3612275-Rhodomonas_salina.3